eukprot:jgi/Tetstr1/460346/TSEL_005645.t1
MAKELRKSRGEELFAVAVREVFDAVAELRTDQSTEWTEELKESLMEFADIIAEPTDLPPEREFDFEINLEKSHLDYRALLASVVNFLFFARGLTGVSYRVQDVHVDTYNITLQIYREKGRAGRRGPDDLRVLLLPVSEHPRVARLLHHFIDNVQSVPMVTVGLAASNFWAVNVAEQSKPWTAATMSDWLSTTVNLVNAAPLAGASWTSHSLRKGAASAANAIGAPLSHIRYQGGWATNSDVVLDYIDPNVLPSPGAWFFFGHIAPLRHFQVQQDSAAVAFPVPPS